MLWGLCLCSYGAVELVKDGIGVSDIVVASDALSSVKTAAEDLRKHIELISGAKLDIVNAPSDKMKNHIYVGLSEFTKKLGVTVDDLKVEGFKIIAKDNYLILIGKDEQREPFPYSPRRPEDLEKWQKFAGEKYWLPDFGQPLDCDLLGFRPMDATATLYAVSEFLEQLGVRFYAPYENGTVVPSKKTIAVDEQNIKKEPAFSFREVAHYAMLRNDLEGAMWIKHLKYGRSNDFHYNHSMKNILGSPEMRKLHPEYYAMANGAFVAESRGGRASDVPRLTDPGFRKTSLNFVNKVFEAYPQATAYSLGMNDGFTEIDERDAVKWTGSEWRNKFSDYVWDYWVNVANELKKSHPDKYLTCMAYSTYFQPPSNIDKLPDNVALILCYWTTGMITPTSEDIKLPGGNDLRKLRSEWLDKLTSKKLYVWDYYLFYNVNAPAYPVVFTKLLQKEMQELKGVCEGKFIEMSYTPKSVKLVCPGLSHLLYYWQGKLYWDPDMDRGKMLNEYYELYFGPAKAEMKEFYEFAEDVWMRPESRSISLKSGFLKEQDVERYFDILKRAREKAGKDTVYDKRIAEIETEMQMVKPLFTNLKKRNGPEFKVYLMSMPLTLDGDLEKPFWSAMQNWYVFSDPVSGNKLAPEGINSTEVAFRLTKAQDNLVIGLRCREPEMSKLVANTTKNDDKDIFNDDNVEIYIETPERSYFRIVVNSNGAILDESHDTTIVQRDSMPLMWNPGCKAVVKKEKDKWTVELFIPREDFGKLGPTATFPWGINLYRTRMVDGKPEKTVLVPKDSPDGFKLGNLRLK